MSGLQAVQGDLVDLRSLLTLCAEVAHTLLAPFIPTMPPPAPPQLPHCQLIRLKLSDTTGSASLAAAGSRVVNEAPVGQHSQVVCHLLF